ncbi:hypothetical protein QE152_g27400 [Popillia japonica]|uniref:Integrase catalytic domain-containing protein n=1 Tax=Popillia japonica TaxID=7064 RepID=A0AAW1JT27_POPJA
MEILAIHFLSNLPRSTHGYKNILVIVDIFSKYVKLIPTKYCDSETTLQGIHEFITEHGQPNIVLSDNATYFNSQKYKQYFKDRDIKTYYTSIRHPQMNLSERIIKEIIKYMRILLQDNHQLWARNLPKVEYILNNTPSTIHERSPIEIMRLENPHRPWNAAELSNYHALRKSTSTLERSRIKQLPRDIER